MSPPLPTHVCHAVVASVRGHGASWWRLPVALTAATLVALSATPAAAATIHHGSAATATMSSPLPGQTVEQAADASVAPAPVAAPHVFATIGDLEFVTPSPRPLLVGFHQAAGGTVAFTPVAGQVLASRGRGTSPTSAVDVALEPDDPVLAVVTGTVTEVAPYTLYGLHHDVLVTIAPDERPDLRVRLLHVDDVRVTPGQHVSAGRDVIAGTARQLPVRNQVDRYVGRSVPHLHVEVVGG